MLALECFDLNKLLVPASFQSPGDDAVLWFARIELALRSLGVIARALEAKLPLSIEGRVLFFHQLNDTHRVEQLLACEHREQDRSDRLLEVARADRHARLLRE